jgi:hypothetical protein
MTVRFHVMSEAELLSQVTELAELYGWQWVHFRPARTKHGWRTPVQGPLGEGWPDLVLTKPGRILAAELKRAGGAEPEQAAVLVALREAGAEIRVWTPADWDDIVATLTASRRSPP